MIAFNDLSISQKLTRMNVIVIALLLMTTCAAFVGYEIHAFTNTAADHLSTDADIVGIDVTPAVLFNDAAAARESLLALRATPNVTQAAVYTSDGRMFARYVRSNGSRGLAPTAAWSARSTASPPAPPTAPSSPPGPMANWSPVCRN